MIHSLVPRWGRGDYPIQTFCSRFRQGDFYSIPSSIVVPMSPLPHGSLSFDKPLVSRAGSVGTQTVYEKMPLCRHEYNRTQAVTGLWTGILPHPDNKLETLRRYLAKIRKLRPSAKILLVGMRCPVPVREVQEVIKVDDVTWRNGDTLLLVPTIMIHQYRDETLDLIPLHPRY